jgi:site-specific recombinase XerD
MKPKTETKIALHLDNRPRKEDGLCQFYLRVRIGKKYSFFKSGEWMHPDFWEGRRIKEVKGNAGWSGVVTNLDSLKGRIRDIIAELNLKGEPVTERTVRNHWEHTSERNLVAFCYERLEKERTFRAGRTLERYAYMTREIQRFDPAVNLEQVTSDWLEDYVNHLRIKRGLSGNTVLNHFDFLGKIFNYALNKNLIIRNPIRNMSGKPKYKKPQIVFLEGDEIERMYRAYQCGELLEKTYMGKGRLKPRKGELLHKVLGQALVGIYTGLRYGDLAKLNDQSQYTLSHTHLMLTMEKTGKSIRILLTDRLKSLLNLSGGGALMVERLPGNWLMNVNLREVMQELEINKNIHVHGLRHTFVTELLSKGAKIERVSKMVGHESVRVTERYTHVVNTDLDETARLWDEGNATPEQTLKDLMNQVIATLEANPAMEIPLEFTKELERLRGNGQPKTGTFTRVS